MKKLYRVLGVVAAALVLTVVLRYADRQSDLSPQSQDDSPSQDSNVVSEQPSVHPTISRHRIVSSPETSGANDLVAALPVERTEHPLTDGVGQTFTNADWNDRGFRTAAATVQTYYWAMRASDLNRWLDCMTPDELGSWQMRMSGRQDSYRESFSSGVNRVSYFVIESTEPVSADECVVATKHTLDSGEEVREWFAVAKIGDEWKINGETGFLSYPHHPSRVNKHLLSGRTPR